MFADSYTNVTPTADAGILTSAAFKTDTSANTSPAKTITVDAAGNTAFPLIISGDTLIIDNDTNEIFGKGHVAIRHADNLIFADLIYINPDTGDVSGEGNVLAVFNNSRIYTEKIYYNTKKQDAFCKNADVISPPWIIRCEKMVKEGEKTELTKPIFTTCDDIKPHYRMEASEIYLYGKKKIEAWNIGVYLGTIPILYFPYYAQSLEASKDPFEFQVKYNDAVGFYTNIKYNFFLGGLFDTVSVDGQLGFDYYQKGGPAFNANLQYVFSPASMGSFAGSYMEESTTKTRRWWLNFGHSQVFTDKIRAGLTARSSSDSKLEADYLAAGQVDMFKHELTGSFTGIFNNHTIGVDVNDTEQLDPLTSQYYTYTRLLPRLSYNMSSTQIFPYFYYNHALNLTRSYQASVLSAASEVVYSDVGSFNPGIMVNTPKLVFATFSGTANLFSDWTKKNENDKGWGELLNKLNTTERVQLELLPNGYMMGFLTHSYNKQLNKTLSLDHDGITANNLQTGISGGFGTFTGSAGLSYDLLKDRAEYELSGGNEFDRFSMLNLNAGFNQDVYYMSVRSNISLYSKQVRDTSLYISVVDNSPKSLWSFSANAGFINNRIDGLGHPVTYTPAADSLTFSTAFSFDFTPDFQVTVSRNYDLAQKTLIDQRYSLTWFIHCWQADISWSRRQNNVEEILFSVAIAAIPEFRISKPTTAGPDQFNNLQNIIAQ